MEKDILKLLPQKAFRLISIKETLRVGALLTQSLMDKNSYQKNIEQRTHEWKIDDIKIVMSLPLTYSKVSSKEHGESILKIYFSQFFDPCNTVHLDLRQGSFGVAESLYWIPSKLHYTFSAEFIKGVCLLYEGFYFDQEEKFEQGLTLLGILKASMSGVQKKEIINLFYLHFGDGKTAPVKFSLKKLQDSFNSIFTYFIKEDVPMNPEFAVLGAMLVTLYTCLQEIDCDLNVREAFVEVVQKYKPLS